MPSEHLLSQPVDLSSNSIAVDQSDLNAGNSVRQAEGTAAVEQADNVDFSIDELREIARHFGVPDRALITERDHLIEAIRHRI